MQYFASGFLFLSAYDFAGSLPREKEKEYFFVKSITVSFVINAIISFLFNKAKVDMQYYFLALILSAVVLGLLLGRARSFGWINTICIKVFRHNIADNIFLTIWSSVSNGKCLYIRFKKNIPQRRCLVFIVGCFMTGATGGAGYVHLFTNTWYHYYLIVIH